ncbi:MAG: YCF48-related protein [bacterium]|nr:YCF48-related protein [bacterium]
MKTVTNRHGVTLVLSLAAAACAAALFSGRFGGPLPLYGSEWASLSAGAEEKGLRAVAVDPLNPQRIFIGSSRGVFLSSDAGGVWVNCLDLSAAKRTVPPGLPPAQKAIVDALQTGGEVSGVTALAIDPANTQKVFAGSVDGIYGSADGGRSWTRANGALKGLSVFSLGLAIDPSNPDMVYAGTLGNGMLKSTDGGASWRRVEIAPGEDTVASTAVHPFDSGVLYAGTTDALYKTRDGGATWRKVFAPGKAVRSVAIDQVNPETAYAGTAAGLYKSGDGGASWAEIGADMLAGKPVAKVAVSPSDSNAVYAAAPDGVYGSLDAGARWQDLSRGTGLRDALALAFDPLDSSTIWAATAGGLYRTAVGRTAAPVVASAPVAAPQPVAAEVAEEVAPIVTKPVEEAVEVVSIEEPPARRPAAFPVEEGPPIPTIDDVQTVLMQYSHEPSVQEIQEVAMRFAEVHPDIIESWRKGAKFGALLPRFKLKLGQRLDTRDVVLRTDEERFLYRDNVGTRVYDQLQWSDRTGTDLIMRTQFDTSSDFERRLLTAVRVTDDERRQRDVVMEFTWDLSDFMYNPNMVRISNESRNLVELRNDVLQEVTQFYFQRRQLQIDLLLSPSEDLRERLRLELQLQEVTANIDFLTGGYLTQRLNDIKSGTTRQPTIIKRLFAL